MKYVVAAVSLLLCSPSGHANLTITPDFSFVTRDGPNIPATRIANGRAYYDVWVGPSHTRNGPPSNGFIIAVMRASIAGGPVDRPWNTVYNSATFPEGNPYYYGERDILSWQNGGAQYLCAFAGDPSSVSNWRNLGSCVPFDGRFQTPTLCRIGLASSIGFGTVPSSSNGVRETITGTVTCDEDASVTLSAGDSTQNSSRVSLSSNNDVYAQLDLNGNNPLPGILLSARRNSPSTFTLGATLELLPNVQPGTYSGSSVVRIDWP